MESRTHNLPARFEARSPKSNGGKLADPRSKKIVLSSCQSEVASASFFPIASRRNPSINW